MPSAKADDFGPERIGGEYVQGVGTGGNRHENAAEKNALRIDEIP